MLGIQTYAQKSEMLIRIAEIELFPEYVEEYNAILKEEASASIKLEKGVIAIFPLQQEMDKTKVRILEIYENQEAYQLHLKTPHFLKYKTTTSNMVKELKLVNMNTIDDEMMSAIFKK